MSNNFKYLTGLKSEDVRNNVIITPFLNVRMFASYLESPVEEFKGLLYSGVNSRNITVIKSGISSVNVGNCVMFLNDTKAEKLVFAGSCAGLGETAIGDHIIIEKAFNGECFSDYVRNNTPNFADKDKISYPDNKLVNTLKDYLKTNKLKFSIAYGYTTGVFLHNLPVLTGKLPDSGFRTVDMESSAFYTASDSIKRASVAFCYVSDRIPDEGFEQHFKKETKRKVKASRSALIKQVCAFLKTI